MALDYDRLPKQRVGDYFMWDVRSLFPDRAPGYERRGLGDVEIIVQHHSADSRIAAGGSKETYARLAGIYEHHTQANGWPGIGYHYIVDNWGHIFMCGGVETVRYHVAGKNARSVGVCLLGNYEYYLPSMWALLALRDLHSWIRHGLGRMLPVIGHGAYAVADPPNGSPTSCPGATWPMWNAIVDRNLVPHLVGGDFVGQIVAEWLKRQAALP